MEMHHGAIVKEGCWGRWSRGKSMFGRSGGCSRKAKDQQGGSRAFAERKQRAWKHHVWEGSWAGLSKGWSKIHQKLEMRKLL